MTSSYQAESPALGIVMPGAEAIHPIKLNDVDPQAWLTDVLVRLPDHPAKHIHELLPWAWKRARETSQAVAA